MELFCSQEEEKENDWGEDAEWETDIPSRSVEIKTNHFAFEAPGLCSVLYSHQCELIKELSNKVLISTATQQEKNRCHKILETRKKELGMPKTFLEFLANTDAEYCLGAGKDKQTLGSQKVLELVISFLFDTPDGFETIGKEFMGHIQEKKGPFKKESQQKVIINNRKKKYSPLIFL